MKFDVVIGNPPYNNDLYLDFVQTGYNLLKDDGVMVQITPAKWQAKGGEDYDAFRKDIVSHISDVVFYPACTDVFPIAETGGITYFKADKENHIVKHITNICKDIPAFNNKRVRPIVNALNNLAYDFINNYEFRSLAIYDMPRTYRYKYIVAKLMSGGVIAGKMLVLNPPKVIDDMLGSFKESNFKCRFSSDDKSEVESFVSYVYTKFVRFLVLLGLTANYIVNNETWRFVPDPGQFDHIFTDDELYKKYNLTQDEINIIESVIKERK